MFNLQHMCRINVCEICDNVRQYVSKIMIMWNIPFSQFKHTDIAFKNEMCVCLYVYIYYSRVENKCKKKKEKSLLALGFSFFCSLPPQFCLFLLLSSSPVSLLHLSLSHLMYKSSSTLFFLLSSLFHRPLSAYS